MHTIQLPIRYLCEFLLKGGSIDSRFSGLDRGALGSRLHRYLQKQGGKNYAAEVAMSAEIELDGFCYQLAGRADGVISTEDGPMVDEIKTTPAPLPTIQEEDHPAHWAQGCCYAHILCVQQNLPGCAVQLTYCNTETLETKRFVRQYTALALEELVLGLLHQYLRWAKLTVEWEEKRNASLQALTFPFAQYRDGQRKMAVACYNTIQNGARLFCCAPTGIGKTLSALFPAMKALGEGHGKRIFYLTAKTIARKAAEDAIALLRSKETLFFNSLTLTAKDKICFLEERACLPEICPYANGYYDRSNDAVYEILQTKGAITREVLEDAAQQYELCPYELSLDLALWCDCIICDYNYLFDPVVHLQRFFEGKGGDNIFLIDEAHNLVDRSRDMYSAQLKKSGFYGLKKQLPKQYKRLHNALAQVNSAFIVLRKQCQAQDARVLRQKQMPDELRKPVAKFIAETESFLEEHKGTEFENELLQLYFDALFYQDISEQYGNNYITLLTCYSNDVSAKLLCLDSAEYLDASMALGRASILFSATLLPLPYYRNTLGGGEAAHMLALGSPFKTEHLGLFVADGISTKYADRESSLEPVANLLAAMVEAKQGNYIAYFPSYSYMQQVLETFEEQYPQIKTLVQSTGMDEVAREDFLASFTADAKMSMLGFCVMGGIFAEGVDLPGNRLIGTAIVGVGLPQIGPEPDSVREYFDALNGCGFEYAYQFPGMNKVLQAAGRVIRTEEDRGVVLLIDSRFSTRRYLNMFPAHWGHWQRTEKQSLPTQLQAFWQVPDEP